MWNRFPNNLVLATVMSLLAAAVGCTESKCREVPGQGTTDNSNSCMDPLAPQEAAQQIKIDNFTFDPPTLTIAVGTKVTWVNRDDVPHTATSTAKPRSFNSGTLDTDQQFSHVFAKPGTYDYFCAVHPKMTGRIVVK
jgi:plastocyanin